MSVAEWVMLGGVAAFLALCCWAWNNLEAAEYRSADAQRRRDLADHYAWLDAGGGANRSGLHVVVKTGDPAAASLSRQKGHTP